MSINKILFSILLGVGVSLPTNVFAEDVSFPNVSHNKSKASKLCRSVVKTSSYKKIASQDKALAKSISNELCEFYAASAKNKVRYWNKLLDQAVQEELLTSKDRRVLKGLFKNPETVMAKWKPNTDFGKNFKREMSFLGINGQNQNNGNDAQNSTAGDVGTIVGAMLGGLGGSPLSVGIGAGVGRLMGEGANALGEYWYDLAGSANNGDGNGEEEGNGNGGEGVNPGDGDNGRK